MEVWCEEQEKRWTFGGLGRDGGCSFIQVICLIQWRDRRVSLDDRGWNIRVGGGSSEQ